MRDYLEAREFPSEHDFFEAVRVINAYRRMHAAPLQRVAVGLRYYVAKHTTVRPITVGQRLKRMRTMLDKLRRQPGMKLARMQDIAGCRAVVATEAQVRGIAADLDRQRRWEVVRTYDYMEEPKPDGYRAFHVVIEKDGRLVEVQLRTLTQHAWAELIETVDRRNPGMDLKGGRAPADVVEYYRLGSMLLASSERGQPLDEAVRDRFRILHEKVASTLSPNPEPPD